MTKPSHRSRWWKESEYWPGLRHNYELYLPDCPWLYQFARPEFQAWFANRCIRQSNGCLLWAPDDFRVTLAGGYIDTADRLSYCIKHRREPGAWLALWRTCPNPRCVEPAHLKDGTHQDNMDHMKAAGRQARGARHPRAWGKPERARWGIAKVLNGMLVRDVAASLACSESLVRSLLRDEHWSQEKSDPIYGDLRAIKVVGVISAIEPMGNLDHQPVFDVRIDVVPDPLVPGEARAVTLVARGTVTEYFWQTLTTWHQSRTMLDVIARLCGDARSPMGKTRARCGEIAVDSVQLGPRDGVAFSA